MTAEITPNTTVEQHPLDLDNEITNSIIEGGNALVELIEDSG